MNTILTVLLTVICLSIQIGVLVIVIILGTRSRLKYARQIREAQARGAFADLGTLKNKIRFRLLSGSALFGVLGFMCLIGVFALQSFS